MRYNRNMESSVDTLKGHLIPQIKRLQTLAKREPNVFKPALKRTQELIEKSDAQVENLEYRFERNRAMIKAFSRPKPLPSPKKPTLWRRITKGKKAA